MLLIRNRGFNKSYVYGGSGFFSSFANAVASLFGRETIKQAATQLTKKVATEAGKKLAEKGVEKISSLTSKSKEILNKRFKPSLTSQSQDILQKSKEILNKRFKVPLTSQSQDILQKYITSTPPEEEFNLNALIAGSAIRIEDYIKNRAVTTARARNVRVKVEDVCVRLKRLKK